MSLFKINYNPHKIYFTKCSGSLIVIRTIGDEMIMTINFDSHNDMQIVFQKFLATQAVLVETIGEVTDG